MKKNNLTTEEIKKAGFEVLSEIDRVAKILGLKYYLAYGTLLGAVRHKGFIPWDDDVDIWMFRSDLKKLVSEFNNVCSSDFRLFTYNDDGYPYPFPKVCNLKTSVREIGLKKIPHLGVWVDIFALDNVATDVEAQTKKLFQLEHTRWLNLFKQSVFWNKLKLIVVKFSLPDTKFSDFAHAPKQTLIETEKVLDIPRDTSKVRSGTSVNEINKIYPVNWFGEGIQMPFEGMEFTVPTEYDKVLSLCYGDYMKLPPVIKRKFVKHFSYSCYTEKNQREI